MVDNLWATVNIVQSANFSLIYFCTNASVSKSTLAVASSKTTILAFLSIARARHKSYFYPTEKVAYLKAITWSNSPLSSFTFLVSPT